MPFGCEPSSSHQESDLQDFKDRKGQDEEFVPFASLELSGVIIANSTVGQNKPEIEAK